MSYFFIASFNKKYTKSTKMFINPLKNQNTNPKF